MITEWILSLAMPREKAATVAGDLVELAESRGTLWLGWAIVRTIIPHMWEDIRSAPGQMSWIAFWGVMYQFGFTWFLPWPGWRIIGYRLTHLGLHVEPATFSVGFVIEAALYSIALGWWVGRRAVGKELGAWLSYAVPSALFIGLVDLMRYLHPERAPNFEVRGLWLLGFGLAGAIYARRRPPRRGRLRPSKLE